MNSKRAEFNLNYPITIAAQPQESLFGHGFIVTDSNLSRIYPRFAADAVVIPAGESSKSLEVYATAAQELIRRGVRRADSVVAFGGGVVGDLAGFVAATLHRGVKLIQVPTSLLAMVDSSVGGKVGIDLPEGKNLLGAFHNPDSVHICTEFLRTLPSAEFTNGLAEIIKCAWIARPALIERLRQPFEPESSDLAEVIEAAIAVKAEVVREDFKELSGRRAILNFGHSVGHALEAAFGYRLRHGEAVAIGMVAEIEIGHQIGVTPFKNGELCRMLDQHGLPTVPPPVEIDKVIDFMARDKKNTGLGLSMSLLTQPGGCKLVEGIEPGLVAHTLKRIWSC